MYRLTWVSPLGNLLLSADEGGLTSVVPAGPGVSERAPCPLLEEATSQLEAYFAGALREFSLPLNPRGTPFQLAVWAALREIPYGQTRTYGQIARAVGHPRAARAVGAACRGNPLLIVVPCHRVIGANGTLTGFTAGLDRKERLLRLEGGIFQCGRLP